MKRLALLAMVCCVVLSVQSVTTATAAGDWKPYPWYDPNECSIGDVSYAKPKVPVILTQEMEALPDMVEALDEIVDFVPEEEYDAAMEQFRSSVRLYNGCVLANWEFYIRGVLGGQDG